jgi:hypothetical protein
MLTKNLEADLHAALDRLAEEIVLSRLRGVVDEEAERAVPLRVDTQDSRGERVRRAHRKEQAKSGRGKSQAATSRRGKITYGPVGRCLALLGTDHHPLSKLRVKSSALQVIDDRAKLIVCAAVEDRIKKDSLDAVSAQSLYVVLR